MVAHNFLNQPSSASSPVGRVGSQWVTHCIKKGGSGDISSFLNHKEHKSLSAGLSVLKAFSTKTTAIDSLDGIQLDEMHTYSRDLKQYAEFRKEDLNKMKHLGLRGSVQKANKLISCTGNELELNQLIAQPPQARRT